MKGERFLLIRLGALGDILHTRPVAHTLRRHYPQAHITWALEEQHLPMLEGNPDIDEVLLVNTRRWRKAWNWQTVQEMKRVKHQLRTSRFEVVLDVQGLIKSGVLAYLTQAPVRIGFSAHDCREPLNTLFTTHQVAPSRPRQHVIYRNLALLNALEITQFHLAFPFHIPVSAEETADEILRKHGMNKDPFIILNPGAGWKTKQWGSGKYARLSEAITGKLGLRTLLTWGPGEEELVHDIARVSRSSPIVPPLTTIKELAALLQRALLFVGGDTGPLHLAAALQKPVVGIYGPSDPLRNGPFGTEHLIIRHRLPCSNCFQRTCPTTQCLQEVGVEEVFQGVEMLLQRINLSMKQSAVSQSHP